MEPITIATNKRAYHDYHIEEKYEAGIVLFGLEVKPVRAKQISIAEAWIKVDGGIPTLVGATITPSKLQPWEEGKYKADRPRALLLKKNQIRNLELALQKGMTIIPLKAYFNTHGILKIEIGVGKGRKNYDKRQILRNRDFERHGD